MWRIRVHNSHRALVQFAQLSCRNPRSPASFYAWCARGNPRGDLFGYSQTQRCSLLLLGCDESEGRNGSEMETTIDKLADSLNGFAQHGSPASLGSEGMTEVSEVAVALVVRDARARRSRKNIWVPVLALTYSTRALSPPITSVWCSPSSTTLQGIQGGSSLRHSGIQSDPR